MKKFSIFLLLMAFFAPLAMNGQTTLLSEDFENNFSLSYAYSPDGWFAYNAGDGESNWACEDDSDFGSYVMTYWANYDFDADCYLVSAPFYVSPEMINLSVSLKEATYNSDETFEVFFVKANDITTDEDVASATPYSAIYSYTYSNSVYEETPVDISGSNGNSALAGQSVRVVVHCTSTVDEGWLLYIDDITVTETIATTTPSITLSPNPATVAMGFTETLTATIDNVTGTPTISYSSSNTSVATVSGSGTTATVTGVALGTATITATMTYQGTNYFATSDITVVEPSLCTPSFPSSQGYTGLGTFIISFFTTEGKTNINNIASGLSANGYGDFYDSYPLSADVSYSLSAEAGQTIGFTVRPASTANSMKYAMWIDWNQDNVFNNTGENVALQSIGIRDEWTGSFTIPAGTPVGNYRIRIMGMYSPEGDIDPCKQGQYGGEAEDYKLIVSDALVFATEGSWNDLANWTDAAGNAINVLPTLTDKVRIDKNVTIQNGTVGYAKEATLNGGTITIADGGQLKTNSPVAATVKKTILGYGAGHEADKARYYLISNPLQETLDYNTTSTHTVASTNLLNGTYDLYKWDYTQDKEWTNYEGTPFYLSNGLYGYLYANEATTELSFTGTVYTNGSYQSRRLDGSTSTSYDFPGWHLIGNPYVCNAYLVSQSTNGTALPYYRMNSAGDGFEAVTNGSPIAPMEGVFYANQTNSAVDVYMVRTAPASKSATLNMQLCSNDKQLDNAIVRFDKGEQLTKFSFREGSSKIFFPQEGKVYAVVNANDPVGEMPVNFKAENNGTYTLIFTTEEISFAYLHLIDNMTGNDIDLLKTPNYSFNAKSSDYESRFKLVFSTGNNTNDDTFAFYSNGSFIINNEGNATLQVIDVNGRILKSESINGCTSVNVNAAQGVYMLRLVNGDNVKVQKVVVR